MLEVAIEDAACTLCLEQLGVRSIKLNLTGNTGWPDRLFFIPGGRPLLIEFKQPGETPEPRQRLIHAFLSYNNYDIETHTTTQGAVQAVTARLAAAVEAGWQPSTGKAQLSLAAACLSKEGREVPPRQRRGGAVPRPRSG